MRGSGIHHASEKRLRYDEYESELGYKIKFHVLQDACATGRLCKVLNYMTLINSGGCCVKERLARQPQCYVRKPKSLPQTVGHTGWENGFFNTVPGNVPKGHSGIDPRKK